MFLCNLITEIASVTNQNLITEKVDGMLFKKRKQMRDYRILGLFTEISASPVIIRPWVALF